MYFSPPILKDCNALPPVMPADSVMKNIDVSESVNGNFPTINLPTDNAIAVCVSRKNKAHASGGYGLPAPLANVSNDLTKIRIFLKNFGKDPATGSKLLPTDLQQQVQQQLATAALTLIEPENTTRNETLEHQLQKKDFTDEFLAISEHLSQGRFTGGDAMSNVTLFARSKALASGVQRMQDGRSTADIHRNFAAASVVLGEASREITSMQAGVADVALLESTLGELGHLLVAMQDKQCPPDLDQLLAIETALAALNKGMPVHAGALNTAFSETCMDVQRLVAWTKLQVVAQQVDAGDIESERSALLNNCLLDAMAVETAIVSAAASALRAMQDGSLQVDALTELGLQTRLVQFISVHQQFGALMHAESTTTSKSGNRIHSDAARQLEAWQQSSDIGGEIMRLFISVLIRMREGMRESRQFALTLYSQHADAAISALKQQADNAWMEKVLNASGSIASGVLQLAPVMYKFGKGIVKNAVGKNTLRATELKTAASSAEKTNNNMRAIQEEATSASSKNSRRSKADEAESTPVTEKTQAKKSKSKKDTAETAREAENDATQLHAKMNRLQLNLAYLKAIGDIGQGSLGIAAAYYGWYKDSDGVRHFAENAEMQKQIFQRDRWDKEVDARTSDIGQVMSVITELQTAYTSTTKRLLA
jgi:hypothetical protein